MSDGVVQGRPTIYHEDMLIVAEEYLSNYKTKHKHVIPSAVGLAQVLRISKSTLYNWAKQDGKEKFLDTLAILNDCQELTLLNGGLTNELNPTIVKLALANHGYGESVDITTGDRKENPAGDFNNLYDESDS